MRVIGGRVQRVNVPVQRRAAPRTVRCDWAGLGKSPRLLLRELSRLQSVDIVLPTAEPTSRDLRIRCVVRPDRAQAELLARLGLRLPERLRIPVPRAKM